MRQRGGTVSTFWSRAIKDREVGYRVRAHYSPGHPGRTYGDPDECYPPEEAEVDYSEVYEIEGTTQKKIDMGDFLDSLTKEQDAELKSRLIEEAEDYGTDQESVAADDAYDRAKDDAP